MAADSQGQFKGIGQFIIVGNEDEVEAFQGLAGRLEAIGIKKGEFSENEKLDAVYDNLFQKMFPRQDFSEVTFLLDYQDNMT